MSRNTVRQIEPLIGALSARPADLLVVPLAKGERSLPAEVAALYSHESDPVRVLLASGDFRGELGDVQVAYAADGPFRRILLLGLGDLQKWSRERLRATVASSARRALELTAETMVLPLPFPIGGETLLSQLETAAEAVLLGAYGYDAPKAPDEVSQRALSSVLLHVGDGAGAEAAQSAVERGSARARATNLARDLGHAPANLMTPTHLAECAAEIASAQRLELRVLDRADAERLGMGAFLGVTQGSVQPPRMIFLRYDCGDPQAPTVALVGKGVTFDTGGISLKPAAKMDEMKYDMCGAAAVLGAMSAVRSLDVSVNVVGAVAAAENMPGGSAIKPGDVLRSYSGKTIEVLNTDAEGRLVLADALSYVVRNYAPAAVLDFATLTGAIIVALGHYGAGVFSNDDALWSRIKAAADTSGDRAWRLPIWEEMLDHLKTPFADLKNIADGNAGGGSIAAGAFLREFVEGTPWAHIDIAGTAWWDKDRPHIPKGASGFGVRLALDVLLGFSADSGPSRPWAAG